MVRTNTKSLPIPDLMLLAFVISSFIISTNLPIIFGYFSTAATLGAIYLWLLSTKQFQVIGPKPAILLYVIILVLFLLSSIFYWSMGTVQRLIAFLSVTTVIIFILVHLVDFRNFWRWYAIVSAGIIVLGLPTLFIYEFALGPVVITAWGPSAVFGTNRITSIFANPNTLALVCAFAVVGILTTQRITVPMIGLILINLLGLIATGGRAAQLATVVGVGVYTIGVVVDRSTVRFLTISGVSGIIVIILMMLRIIPGPEAVATVNLTGRRIMWSAAAQAIQERLFLGYGTVDTVAVIEPYVSHSYYHGLGSHNSFLRVALNGGIIAAIAYIGLYLYGLHLSSLNPTRIGLASHAMLWTSIVIQLFNGASIFGLSTSSIIFAVALGWSLSEFQAPISEPVQEISTEKSNSVAPEIT